MLEKNVENVSVKKTSVVTKIGVVASAVVVTATNAMAAPLAAPDTTDIMGTIAAFGAAAIAVKLGFVIYPIAASAVGRLFRSA